MNTNHDSKEPVAKSRPGRKALTVVIIMLVVLIASIGGASMIQHSDWTTQNIPPDFSDCYDVCHIVTDSAGRIWLGHDHGLAVQTAAGGWTSYTHANSGLLDDNILSISADGQGRIWVGMPHGLSVFAPNGTWTSYTPANSGLAGEAVRALTTDPQGRVWAATVAGLSVLAPDGTWTTYTVANSALVGNTISALATDKQGRVWIGSDTDAYRGGVNVVTPDGSWTTITSLGPQKPIGTVTALEADPQGGMWVAAQQSDSFFKHMLTHFAVDGSSRTYTMDDTPAMAHFSGIKDLVIDGQGRLWAADINTLAVLAPDDKSTEYTPRNSGFFSSMDFMEGLAADKQGRLWVVMRDRMVTFDDRTNASPDLLLNVRRLLLLASVLVLLVLGRMIVVPWVEKREAGEARPDSLPVGFFAGLTINAAAALALYGLGTQIPCPGCMLPWGIIFLPVALAVGNLVAIFALRVAGYPRMAAGIVVAVVALVLIISRLPSLIGVW